MRGPKRVGDSKLRWLRHPLRVLALTAAAMCLAWPLATGAGVVSAGVGAALGVIVGELLGQSRLRAPVVFGLLAVGFAVTGFLGHMSTHSELVPGMVGPAMALKVGTVLRFGCFAFFPLALVRAAAARRPTVAALELAFVVASLTFLFAAHRGGVIARPLWLSDWAWRHELDPANVLMVIGAAAFLLLAAIMWAETGKRVSALTALALPALAALLISLFNLKNLPKPKDENELGLTSAGHGEPPNPTPPWSGASGGNNGQDGGPPTDGGGNDGGDGGESADAADGGDGGGEGADASDADGGGSGQGADASDADGGGSSQSTDASDDGGGGTPPPQPPNVEDPQQSEDQKQAPMAVVILGDDYDPPAQAFYLRQEAWSQFAGARLVATTRGDADRDVPAEYPTRGVPVQDAPPEAGRKVVRARVVMLVEHKRPFALETPRAMAPMKNPNPQRFVRAYRFEALSQVADYPTLVGKKSGNPEWSPEVRDYYLRPPEDPRFAELAKKIVSGLPEPKRKDPFIAAVAVKKWMDKNLIYSTKHRHAGVNDPTADFLFGDKTGYCVHFAHSAVFLWRSLGIPARIGTGYMVNAEAREGSTVLVRAGDAHAWPELYLEGLGWVVLDIAAERNIDPPPKPVNKEEEKKLGQMAREEPTDPLENPSGDQILQKRRDPSRVLLYALVALGALLGAFYLVKGWRRLAPRFASRRAMPRVGYRAALDVLSEAGFTRETGETRERFARRVARVAPAFEELTAMHMAAYLGDPSVPIAERGEFARAAWKKGLGDLKKQVGRAPKSLPLFLCWLNPVSFITSR
ncbi:MAG: transglutaminase domain-containing protein [Myxococcales bacterium]|nr:transglutaminase domain-containing protein [Myxococcales bacterium]